MNLPSLLILACCVGARISENTSPGCRSRCAIVPHMINRCSCHLHIFQWSLMALPSLTPKEAWELQSKWLKMEESCWRQWQARTRNYMVQKLYQQCLRCKSMIMYTIMSTFHFTAFIPSGDDWPWIKRKSIEAQQIGQHTISTGIQRGLEAADASAITCLRNWILVIFFLS